MSSKYSIENLRSDRRCFRVHREMKILSKKRSMAKNYWKREIFGSSITRNYFNSVRIVGITLFLCNPLMVSIR